MDKEQDYLVRQLDVLQSEKDIKTEEIHALTEDMKAVKSLMLTLDTLHMTQSFTQRQPAPGYPTNLRSDPHQREWSGAAQSRMQGHPYAATSGYNLLERSGRSNALPGDQATACPARGPARAGIPQPLYGGPGGQLEGGMQSDGHSASPGQGNQILSMLNSNTGGPNFSNSTVVNSPRNYQSGSNRGIADQAEGIQYHPYLN